MPETGSRIQLTSVRFSPVGAMRGLGSVEFEVSEALREPSGETSLALRLTVEASSQDDYPETSTSTIDYFEIDEIVASLAQLAELSRRKHSFANFQNSFSSKEGIKFVVFNDQRGRINFSVQIEGNSAYFNELGKIDEFSSTLLKAKEKVRSCASYPPA